MRGMDPGTDDARTHDDPDPAVHGGGGRQVRTLVVGVAAVLVVLVGAIFLAGGGTPSPTEPAALAESEGSGFGLTDAVDALPDFTLGQFGGEGTVQVAELQDGRPLVVNFWATWCAPCVAEMPDFQVLHEQGGGDFRLVGINTQDAALNAEPFVEELGITYDLAVDREGDYFALTGGFGMPTTLFVRPDGSVAFRQTGPVTLEQMRELLREHLDVDVPSPG